MATISAKPAGIVSQPSSDSEKQVSLELAKLGAIPLSMFADQTFIRNLCQPGFDPRQYSGASFSPSQAGPSGNSTSEGSNLSNNIDPNTMEPHDAYRYLNKLSTELFGNSNGLVYRLENEPNSTCKFPLFDNLFPPRHLVFSVKKCYLTVSLPNGRVKIYTTAPVYYRKIEAKSAAALVAVKNYVVDFLKEGKSATMAAESKSNSPQTTAQAVSRDKGKGRALDLPDASSTATKAILETLSISNANSPINVIATCCKEIHGNSILPRWYRTQAVESRKVRSSPLSRFPENSKLKPSLHRIISEPC